MNAWHGRDTKRTGKTLAAVGGTAVAVVCGGRDLALLGESKDLRTPRSLRPPLPHYHYLLPVLQLQWFISSPLIRSSSPSKGTLQNVLSSSKTCSRVYISPINPAVRTPFTRDFVDVGENDQPIPLPNVSSSVLKKASIPRVLFLSPFHLSMSSSPRSSSTANITGENDFRPQTLSHKMKLASAPPKSASGIRNSSQSTKRCFSRSSLPQIISISSLSCQCLWLSTP